MRDDGRWQAEHGKGRDGRTWGGLGRGKRKSITMDEEIRSQAPEMVCKRRAREEVAHDWQMRVGCYGRGTCVGDLNWFGAAKHG